jgi:hypothetical protein
VAACALLVACAGASSAQASPGFGIERYSLTATNEDASADTQAGSHPHELTAEAVLDFKAQSSIEVRNLNFELPPGLNLNLAAVPHCSFVEFDGAGCGSGVATVGTVQMSVAGTLESSPVYNLAPAPGEPAELGFTLKGIRVIADIVVRTGGDYGMTVSILNIPQEEVESVKLTLMEEPYAPLLTLPTSCSGPLQTTLQGESWGTETASLSSTLPGMTGCNRLPFEASLMVTSDINEAETPSGYELDLHVPQHEDAEGLASADLKIAAVTLPEGAGISLSAADGLQACTEAQVALGSPIPVTCPSASKIGTVAIRTPLLANPLQGAVYLATPNENPSGSPLAIYISAEDPVAGVTIKLAGQLEPNPVTGQLTIVLREFPQLPISDLELHFFGGERALLSTPPICGLATSTSVLTPWSGTSGVMASSAFEIAMGIDGMACSAAQPFAPTFQATSTTDGATDTYGTLNLFVSRTDQEQELSSIAIEAPAAVAQMFAGVPPCGEPQASEGGCTAASEVGTVAAQAGLGIYPPDLYGRIYLTGPPPGGTQSSGSGQGLSIVLPVDPAPFELGSVVVRAGVAIDPGTGRLNITSTQLPSFVEGARLPLDALLLQFERGEFKIDPTGCESLTVTGTITGAQSSTVAISTEPFGASSSSCPPQAAPAPASTPQAAGVPRSTVSLEGTHVIARGRGKATVKLTCTGTATCRGRLTLTVKNKGKRGKGGKRRSKTTTIGTATFSIPLGKTTTVELQLNGTGRALFGAAQRTYGRLSATLTILKSSPAPSQTNTDSVQLIQRALRRHQGHTARSGWLNLIGFPDTVSDSFFEDGHPDLKRWRGSWGNFGPAAAFDCPQLRPLMY